MPIRLHEKMTRLCAPKVLKTGGLLSVVLFAVVFALVLVYPVSAQTPAEMSIPDNVSVLAPATSVSVPISLDGKGTQISAATFSVDYDESCLTFNPADTNFDGKPDSVALHPGLGPFAVSISYSPATSDSEIRFVIFYLGSPQIAMPEGVLATITFGVTCAPTFPVLERIAHVKFSTLNPPPSLGDITGMPAASTWDPGSVRVYIPAVSVTPSFNPATNASPITSCNTYGSITIPTQTGVDYKINGDPATAGVHSGLQGTKTVTAHAKPGYVLTGTTSWSVVLGNWYACAVTPTAPTFKPIVACDTLGEIVIPTQTGVTYKRNGNVVTGTLTGLQGSQTITTELDAGYVLAPGADDQWTENLGTPTTCINLTAAAPTFTNIATCGEYGSVAFPAINGTQANYAITQGTVGALQGAVEVTATAIGNYRFAPNSTTHTWTQNVGTHKTCATATAPAYTPIPANACNTWGLFTMPSDTASVTWSISPAAPVDNHWAGDYTLTATAKAGYAFANLAPTTSFPLNFGTWSPCDAEPQIPVFLPIITCGVYGSIQLPAAAIPGVIYVHNGVEYTHGAITGSLEGNQTVSVIADEGFTLVGANLGPWTQSVGTHKTCATATTPTYTPIPANACNTWGTFTMPSDTASVTWSISPAAPVDNHWAGDYTLIATAKAGYAFENLAPTTSFPMSFGSHTACATLSLSVDPSGGGSVTLSPSGGSNFPGTVVTLTPVAATGYTFASWGGASSSDVVENAGVYTIVMNGNKTLVANFTLNTYTIAASAGANGSISPTGSVVVNHGANQSFAFTPDAGYEVDVVTVDNAAVPTASSYTFSNVTGNHTIHVTFKLKTYTITASAGANGNISPTGSVVVNHGANQIFAFTPLAGYEVDVVTVDSTAVPTASSYTFSNVTGNHTIHVTFKLKTYTITASAGTNGSISPTGSVVVNHGANQSFAFTPLAGYEVDVVTVDSTAVPTASSYTFSNVTGNHTIHVTFKLKTYTIAASAGANGSISPTGSVVVNHGANQSFAFTPDTGYEVDVVTVDNAAVPTASSHTFSNVTGNHTIHVTFKLKTYVITASAGANGSISPTGSVVVNHGANQSFAFTPDTGYEVDVVTVDNAAVPTASSHTFSNVTGNHTIHVTFKLITTTVTPTAPTFKPIVACDTLGEIVIPTQTGVTYKRNGNVVTGTLTGLQGNQTITTELDTGYVLAPGADDQWTENLGTPTTCINLTAAAPTFTNIATCGEYGSVAFPAIHGTQANYAITQGTVGALQGAVEVTATAIGNYRFAPNSTTHSWTQNVGTRKECATATAPAYTPITACNTWGVFTMPSDTASVTWSISPAAPVDNHWAGDYTLTATANATYAFENLAPTVSFSMSFGTWSSCEVVPTPPTFHPIATCGVDGSIDIPANSSAVVYTLTGNGISGLNKVTATAQTGYVFAGGLTTKEWEQDLGTRKECATAVAPTYTPITACNTWGVFTMPSDTASVTWSISPSAPVDNHWAGDYTLTATANATYAFENLAPTTTFPMSFGTWSSCEVVPTPPTSSPAGVGIEGEVHITPTTGVAFTVTPANAIDGLVTVTATPLPGYSFPTGTQTEWVLDLGTYLIPATPVAPTSSPAGVGVEGEVFITPSTGVAFTVTPPNAIDGIVTVTASPLPGYGFLPGTQTQWTLDLGTYLIPATPVAPTSTPAGVGVEGEVFITPSTGVAFTVTPANAIDGIVTVTASPLPGYGFLPGTQTQWTLDLGTYLTPAMPTAPTFTPAGIGIEGQVHITPTTGVTFTITPANAIDGIVTVTASPLPGYAFPPGTQTVWQLDLGTYLIPATPVRPTVTLITACGQYGSVVFASTAGVAYAMTPPGATQGQITVTATALAGYGLVGYDGPWQYNLGAYWSCTEVPSTGIIWLPMVNNHK